MVSRTISPTCLIFASVATGNSLLGLAARIGDHRRVPDVLARPHSPNRLADRRLMLEIALAGTTQRKRSDRECSLFASPRFNHRWREPLTAVTTRSSTRVNRRPDGAPRRDCLAMWLANHCHLSVMEMAALRVLLVAHPDREIRWRQGRPGGRPIPGGGAARQPLTDRPRTAGVRHEFGASQVRERANAVRHRRTPQVRSDVGAYDAA